MIQDWSLAEARAKALVSRMRLEEKIAMLHGPATGPCCQCGAEECAYGELVFLSKLD